MTRALLAYLILNPGPHRYQRVRVSIQGVESLPDIIPGLIGKYRQLVDEIARLGRNPNATTDDVQRGRGVLSGLFGRIRVEPRGDVLVAKVTAVGAGLLSCRPASLNTSFVLAWLALVVFCTR